MGYNRSGSCTAIPGSARRSDGNVLKEVKQVFKNSAIYGLGGLIPKLAGIVLVPIYTRFLLPADYGLLSLATMVTSMVGVLMMLGQNGSLTLFFRASQAGGDENEIKSLLFTVTAFTVGFSGLLFALMMLLGPWLMPYLVKSTDFAFNPYMIVALLTAFLGVPLGLLQAMYVARGKAGIYTLLNVSSFAINTGFTIYFVVALRQGALGSLKGTLVAAALLVPVSLWLLSRQMRLKFSMDWMRKSLAFGLPLVPHYFAGWILTFADRYMLERYTSMTQVGLYSLAYNISMVLNMVSSAINTAWGPMYYDLAATEEGRAKLPRLTTVYAAAVTGCALAYMLLSREMLLVLASTRYHDAAGLVPIVVAGYYFFALYSVLSTGIFYARKTKWVPIISAAAAVFNIGLNLWLMPRFGMWAAAWNTFAAYALMALIARIASARLSPIGFEDRSLLALLGVFFAAFAANFAVAALPIGLLAAIALKCVVLVLAFASFVWFRIVSVDELKDVWQRIRTRKKASPGAAADLEAHSDEIEGTGDNVTPPSGQL